MRDDLSVIAHYIKMGNITVPSLNESLTQFRNENQGIQGQKQDLLSGLPGYLQHHGSSDGRIHGESQQGRGRPSAAVPGQSDPDAADDYGEKFYDIQGIKKSEDESPRRSGALNLQSAGRTFPHLIKYVGASSDKRTITQKRRIVKQKNVTYAAGNGARQGYQNRRCSLCNPSKLSPHLSPILPSQLPHIAPPLHQF